MRLPDNRSATRLPIFPDAPTIMTFMMAQLLNKVIYKIPAMLNVLGITCKPDCVTLSQ